MLIDEFISHDKEIARYRAAMRSVVRGLWNGELSLFQFVDQAQSAIERNFRIAWLEGASECGIQEDELSPDEVVALGDAVNSQLLFLPSFGDDILESDRASGGRLQPFLDRVELWVNRISEIQNQAKQMACGDQKLKWVIGDAEHCSTCLKLNGRVHRASVWARVDIHPRDIRPGKLECRGFNCQCRFVVTDEPATRGRFPRLP